MGGQTSTQPKADRGKIIAVHSQEHWNTQLKSSIKSKNLMVIYFSAAGCERCKFIEPTFHDLAVVFSSVEFIEIDVDELPDVAKDYGVKTVPTSVVLKKGKELERVVGLKKDLIYRMIDKNRYYWY